MMHVNSTGVSGKGLLFLWNPSDMKQAEDDDALIMRMYDCAGKDDDVLSAFQRVQPPRTWRL